MTTKISQLVDIACVAGVEPSTDKTSLATEHWTFADKIRFVDGLPQKIGGWDGVDFDSNALISGAGRSIFSAVINEKVYTLIGTHSKLYSLIGSRLTNITPLKTSTIAIANSLATYYSTLGSNPIATTNGSSSIIVTATDAAKYQAGDSITLSGATDTGGILAASINTTHIIRAKTPTTITINVGTNATSTATGGGASVILASGLVNVTSTAHGLADGDRVKISGAVDFGGILAADINKEFIIRNSATNSFDVMTSGLSTSAVTAGGGASTIYQEEIDIGKIDASLGQGYGMGLYGVGLYGVSKSSSSGIQFPRIWFFDKFGEKILITAGNQTGLYEWDGSTLAAPTLVSGAPTAINYAFVSNNIAVTLGASDFGNHIFASDINDFTNWTSSSTNQVFEDYIEGASRILSHLSVAGSNLLFTEDDVYTFRYIGLPLIWDIKLKSSSIGIIAPMARVVVNDIAYWMDDKNFYMWRGGDIEIIPSNTGTQSTILKYVFSNLNFSQKLKSFAWYNRDYNEIWFHYPSQASNECDRVARVSLYDYSWTMDTSDRSASEYPDIPLNQPRLIKYTSPYSYMYRHEVGTDDDAVALSWRLDTNLKSYGKDTISSVGVIPDSVQTGNININYKGYLFPQSSATTYDKDYTISPSTERVTMICNARFRKYKFSGSELGQSWQMGKWQEYIQAGGAN